MATCPLCAEEHPKGATACPHCGARLAMADGPRWSGDLLVLPRGKPWVHATGCVMCGAGEALPGRARQLTRSSAAAFVVLPLVFLGPCGLALMAVVLLGALERVTVDLPICDRCAGRWRAGTALLWAFGVATSVGLPALGYGVATLAGLGAEAERLGALVGAFLWPLALIALHHVVSRRLQVRCTLVTFDEVCLAFPDPELARRVVAAG